MKLEIKVDTLRMTEKCRNSFACLSGETNCLCEIEDSFDGRVLFVKAEHKVCEYKMSFGWDGDGADGVRNLKIDGKKVGFKDYFEKDKDKSEKYFTVFRKKSR